MPDIAKRRSKHSPPIQAPTAVSVGLRELDSLLALPVIPQPKPWSDDVERAWRARVACGAPFDVAALSLGIPESTCKDWLSDSPPAMYASACFALLATLKRADALNHTMALGAIRDAWGKSWQAAAWYLERSKGYVVKQLEQSGPSIVVQIGTVNITKGTPRQALDGPVIEAEVRAVLGESGVDPLRSAQSALPEQRAFATPQDSNSSIDRD